MHKFVVSQTFYKSILKRIKPGVLVWGTGFIKPVKGDVIFSRRLDVRAIRGYHSLDLLRKVGGSSEQFEKDPVVADPGLLASMLVDANKIEKKYTLGIIPHYVDKDNPLLKKISVENSIVLDITQPPEKFLKNLAECQNVISSAMHGLIAADSLGIPNVRMVLGDKIVGGDFKFNDYYSAFGMSDHQVINLKKCSFNNEDVSFIKSNYQITKEQVLVKQEALLKSFPYIK